MDEIKKELELELTDYLEKMHRLPLHLRNKILITTKYVYSKLRWRLSIYKLSETWVVQQLDDKIINYVRRWLHFHKGKTLHIKTCYQQIWFWFSAGFRCF